jgi:hypothetical protein
MNAEEPAAERVGISDGRGIQVGRGNVQNNYYYVFPTPPGPEAAQVVANVFQAPSAFWPQSNWPQPRPHDAMRAAGPGAQLVLADFGCESGWQVDRHPRFLADLTGNGGADIIGFGNRGVCVALGNGPIV